MVAQKIRTSALQVLPNSVESRNAKGAAEPTATTKPQGRAGDVGGKGPQEGAAALWHLYMIVMARERILILAIIGRRPVHSTF